jgi:hypothetical protein
LRDIGYFPSPYPVEFAVRQAEKVSSFVPDFPGNPGTGWQKAEEGKKQNAFAAACLSDQGHPLPLFNLQVNPVHCPD